MLGIRNSEIWLFDVVSKINERIMKNFVKSLQDCFMVFAANGPATSTGTTAATAVPVRTGSWLVST